MTETVREIYNCSKSVDFELVVVSPFCVRGPNIKWIKEESPRGASAAQVAAYEASSGDVIVAMSDDVAPTPGWLDGLEREIAEKESRYFPYAGGVHWCTAQSLGAVYGFYYPYFPAISRKSLEAIGGYFSCEYYYAFCDTDLGLRIWDHGGRCEPMPHRMIYRTRAEVEERHSIHKTTKFEHDAKVFMDKWHERLKHRLPNPDAHINVHLGLSHLPEFVESRERA